MHHILTWTSYLSLQKKQVQDQIAQLQNEQAERHSQEIAADTAILDGDIQYLIAYR